MHKARVKFKQVLGLRHGADVNYYRCAGRVGPQVKSADGPHACEHADEPQVGE